MAKKLNIEDPDVGQSDFGAFYPTGSVVVAFPDTDSAQNVRSALLEGGYEENDCQYFPADTMERRTKNNLEHVGFLASLGQSEKMISRYLELARDGSDFLIIYAPTEPESDRVMRVVKRGPFRLAQKYHRLAIEDLQ